MAVGQPLHFKGSKFHRVIPQFMLRAATSRAATAPAASRSGEKFADENFGQAHRPGVLSTNASGTNGSQFFICTVKTPWLDGRHVVFGKVIEGMDVVKAVEAVGSQSGKTSKAVEITDSGEVPAEEAAASE